MIKHQLYPLIEKYFQEYLHGFTKKHLEIIITKGQLNLQYLNLRPDTINKKMDEKNIPLWIKAGLIKKMSIGCSVMNIIGEVPLELKIDGLDIILSPSNKWILKNIDLYKQNILESQFFGDFLNLNIKNPLEINFEKKIEDFDLSVFAQVKELFKDKTIISNLLNIFYEKCYQYYIDKNSTMSIKLKNIHIRIEDDSLINYNGNLVIGIKIDNIDIKLGKKGNMKKNSIKISKLDIYWENQAKILIPSDFLYSLYINGQLQESYYSQIQDIKFQNFNYQRNTKFIVENFNLTINFGTKIINHSKNIDIFNIKTKPLILYVQTSTSELNINLWPELFIIMNNFMNFTEKFKILDKIKEFRPKMKPCNIKEINDPNMNNNFSINKKKIVRNWFYYILSCQKMCKYNLNKNINPLREEFLRYYNIFCKGVDICEKMESKEENKDSINNETKTNKTIFIRNDNNIENSKYFNDLKIEENNVGGKSNFDVFKAVNNSHLRNNKSMTNKNVININLYLNEQKRKQFEENTKLKQINLSFLSEFLIKAININFHPSVKKENLNYLLFKIKDISTKIILSKEKFSINVSTKSIDFGPYNLVYGERELLSPDSYRKLYQDPQANNIREYETVQSRNFANFIDTELVMDELNNNLVNNQDNYNNQGNEFKIRIINDGLNFADNINKKKSRGSSFCSGYKNDFYNIENMNNTLNNNIINQYGTKGTNNRHLNTISNNYYSNNYNLNNNLFNSNQNILENSINNIYNINPKKSFLRLTMAKRTDASIIENIDEMPSLLQNNLTKKQKNELDISQAVNNYNSYKIKNRSSTPISSISPIKLRFNNRNQPFSNKNIPLNLLEIYSNKNNQCFSLSFTKYNNPISIDVFKIELGTIRTNLFANYLLESVKIFKEYTNVINYEKKKKFIENFFKEDNSMEERKQLFYMRQYFYRNISILPDDEKTESLVKYGEYLRKEISLMKIFNTKIEDFQLNYIFSLFTNGIKAYFSFENLECVYYSKFKKISGKFVIPMNEIEIVITIKKIIIKILGMELEIYDLEDIKSILNKIKKIFGEKFLMAEIMLEPCYSLIKKELNINNEDNEDYNNNIKNHNINFKSNNEINTNINIINTNNNNENKIYIGNNNVLLNSYSKKLEKEENKNNNKNDNNNFFIEEDKK